MKYPTIILMAALVGGCALTDVDPHGEREPDITVSLFDEARFGAVGEPIDIGSVAQAVNQGTLKLLPRDYTTMDKDQRTGWASVLGFDGVSINDGHGGDTRRTATLIHPQYVVMATHFRRSVGDTIRWRTSWAAIQERKLVATWHCPGADITLGKLDAPTDGLSTYAILPSGYAWQKALRFCFSIHTDQEGKALVKMINGGVSSMDRQDGQPGRIFYKSVGGKVTTHGDEPLITGDSGNPFFVVYDGQLVLLGVHWTTVSSVFISDPDVIEWARKTIVTQ